MTNCNPIHDMEGIEDKIPAKVVLPDFITSPGTQPSYLPDSAFCIFEFYCPQDNKITHRGQYAKGGDFKMAVRYMVLPL